MIEVHDLAAEIDGIGILSEISFAVPKGQVTALVGPNGAGKSTLLAVMGRLLAAAVGTVSLGGVALAEYGQSELARTLSILRQNTHVSPRLTVQDLVAFGRYPHSLGRLGQSDHDIVSRSISRLDLTEFKDRFLDSLSGGQRQRAFIAMTLAQDTQVLLLDEPLNNLDLIHARAVMKIAQEEARKGKTVVIVLHDLSVAAAYADHVIALKTGKVRAKGSVQEVLNAPVLSDLYDAPVQVLETEGHRVILTV